MSEWRCSQAALQPDGAAAVGQGARLSGFRSSKSCIGRNVMRLYFDVLRRDTRAW